MSDLYDSIRHLGKKTIESIQHLGEMALFIAYGSFLIFSHPHKFRRIIHQVYFLGVQSVFVVCLTGLFTGMVLGIQGYYTLAKFGSEGLLGAAVTLTLIRELGPVLTALMVTGRSGSSIAAELGTMRITEQIDALDTMNINPVKFLVSPRIAACIFSAPLLTAMFDIIGILGGYLTGVVLLGINSGVFINSMITSTVMKDVTSGLIKSLFFGFVIASICCYRGFFCTKLRKHVLGSQSVSLATTSSVVFSSVTVLVLDYVLTALLLY